MYPAARDIADSEVPEGYWRTPAVHQHPKANSVTDVMPVMAVRVSAQAVRVSAHADGPLYYTQMGPNYLKPGSKSAHFEQCAPCHGPYGKADVKNGAQGAPEFIYTQLLYTNIIYKYDLHQAAGPVQQMATSFH